MGALFERPAFLVLFLAFLVVVVIVVVVLAASRSSSKGPVVPPAASPAVGGPGWYPQPDGTQRYWDGQAWTEHTA